MNLAKMISHSCDTHGRKAAIVFEGASYTFNEIDVQVEMYCALLKALGVNKADRVAIQLPKSMEFIFLHLAVLSVGAISLPLNPGYTSDELSYFIEDSGSTFFFTTQEKYLAAQSALEATGDALTVLVDGEPSGSVTSVNREMKKALPGYVRDYPARDSDVAVICYTSGTTGRSKGAMITHRNLISNMMDLKECWRISDSDVLLHALPLFHVHGLFVALHGALNAGAAIIMHEKFDPLRVWNAIESEVCTVLMGVPTMYQRLMNAWEEMERKPDLKSMRVCISGSAPLLENQFDRFEEYTGYRILERYGMTEAGMISSNSLDEDGRKAKSVGFPLPGVQIRVVSSEGRDVTPGEVGEVFVKGDNVFKGYWGMPDKTRDSFAEGWLKSGDLGYQDPQDNGRLYLVGRAKELIITGGYNVYPKEVENLLAGHEAVLEAAVIGLPDKDFGERVTAVVVLRENASSSAQKPLIAFCKEHLAGYKCPKEVFTVDRLPRNAMGKIQKNQLLERFTKPT
jgi:malonyl-CoA/methylmalonyl-CoA synthetase